MTALVEVSAYLPARSIPIGDLQHEIGLSDAELRVFHRVFGLHTVRRDPDGTLTDLALAAVAELGLFEQVKHRIRYLVQARTMPAVAPYPVNDLDQIREKLGLERVQAFSLTEQACASGLFAVDLCGRLLASDGDPTALALVLTGEKTFTRAAGYVPATSVNGECASAVLVSAGTGRDELLGYATRTYGQFFEFQSRDRQALAEFQQLYTDALAEVLEAAAEQAGLAMADVSLVLPHNVNRISWARVARRLGVPLDRVYLDNIGDTGHSFCADPFVNLRTASDGGRLAAGEHYLLTTVGLGATFSAMALRH